MKIYSLCMHGRYIIPFMSHEYIPWAREEEMQILTSKIYICLGSHWFFLTLSKNSVLLLLMFNVHFSDVPC